MSSEHQHIANAGIRPSSHGLEYHGIRNINVAYWNLGTAQLLEHAIQRREGNLASGGAFDSGGRCARNDFHHCKSGLT